MLLVHSIHMFFNGFTERRQKRKSKFNKSVSYCTSNFILIVLDVLFKNIDYKYLIDNSIYNQCTKIIKQFQLFL